MKIVKVNTQKDNSNAYDSIKSSMSKLEEISICNNLDACGCTGNSMC